MGVSSLSELVSYGAIILRICDNKDVMYNEKGHRRQEFHGCVVK